MLTIRTVTSDNAKLVDYYEKDEALIDAQERYYTDSGIISESDEMTCAVWHGKAATELGLSGHANREDFVTLSRGTKPGTNERIRGKKQDEETMERHGHDLCFSAPKSYSMALEVGGDLRLFDAHMRAVKSTMDVAEKMFGNTRIWINGVRQVVNTGNLAMVLIPHHTSRAGDPNLHTHVYVMNGTKGPDGVWRSLSHEDLVHAKWLGSHYRQKLAEEAHALGYRTNPTKDGFELEGYNRTQIEVFSKRHKAIEKKVIQMGLDLTPENKKKAVLTTRKAKRDSGQKLEETQEAWREEGKPYGIETLPLQSPMELQVEPGLMKRELESAIAHLSERSVKFHERDIYQYVFEHVKVSQVQAQDLNAEIQKHKSLIKTILPGQYTTVEALEREIETRNLWMAGQGKGEALKPEANIEGTFLNAGQAEVVLRTLTSTDTHQIWHGFSGVGKTTAFKALKAELENTGVVIRGYATTISAAEGLQKELGIETNTVQHLVLNQPDSVPNQLWLVDEVGMLGSEDMLKLQRQAEAVGARIIIAGDAGQNSSIKAGSPLRLLMKNGATTHKLNKIIRQQNSTQLQAVELIANGDGTAALNLLNNKGYIKEIEDRGERATAIARQFLALSQREQDKTFIVTGTNAERLSITQALRQGLKEQGKLSESVKTVQLVSRQFTAEQSRRIENYSPGDYIQLRINYPGTALERGQLYKVEKRDGNELVVSSFGGRIYRLDPARHQEKDVYYAKNIQIAVGDKLRWTASDKKKGRTNGRHLTVTAINDTTMTVKDVNTKKTQEVSLLEPLPMDYDWVSTSYRAQGRTVKRVIVSTTSDPTASREPFYVKISRQEKELSVYTQDLQKLKEWVSHSNAQENALDLIGDNHGNSTQQRPETGLAPATHGSDSVSESGTTAAEQGTEKPVEQRHEYGTHYGTRGDAGVHSPIQGGARQSKTIGDGGVNQAPGQSHGSPGDQNRQLGANSRPGGLVSGDGSRRDQGLQESTAQQRFSEANEAPVVSPRYVGLDDLAQTDRTIQDAQRLFDSPIIERLGHLIDHLKQSSAQISKPVYENMATLVTGDRSQSDERLLLESDVVDGLEALGQKLQEGLTQSLTPKFDGLGDLAQMDREEQDVQQLLDSSIWEGLSNLAERLEPSTAIEQAQGYKNLGDIVQGDGLETQIQLILESGLLERLESLNLTLTEQLTIAQAPAYEGMGELVQLDRLEPDERLLIENRVIERLDYLAQRLDAAQTYITAHSYERLGELIALETNEKDVRLVLESEIIDRLETLTNQLESRTGVLNDQINRTEPSARVNESDRPHSDLTDLHQLAQPESRRDRERVTETAQRVDDRATQISRSIAERLSGAIISGDVEETIRELARNCESINAEYGRVRDPHEGRAGLESTIRQLAQSVHRLDQQIGHALRRERVNAIAGAITQWRTEQQLGQTLTQFSQVIAALGVDVSQPSAIANDLAQAIVQNNAETELEVALVSLKQMLEQAQAQSLPHTGIQQLSNAIAQMQTEQALVESLTQFNALIQSAQPAPRPSVAEVLAQAIGDSAIEDALVQNLTQLNQAIAQANAQASPAETLAQAIVNTNLETELVENLKRFNDLLTQSASQQSRPDVQQLAALMNDWKAESELTQAIIQFNNLMQSVAQVQSPARADALSEAIFNSSIETEIEATLIQFNELLKQSQRQIEPEVPQTEPTGLERPTHRAVAELAQSLLERRAEDVLNEHLAAFNDATGSVLAELRQRPELAQLVETVQMLRADPTLSEGAAGQQLRELTQGVQQLNPESAMPTGGDRPSLTPKPQKSEVFWVPDYATAVRPDHIEARHWEEMTKSAIHPELIALNVGSLEGEAVYERLLSDKLATMGTGQYVTAPMARLMAQYQTLTEGGWWGTAGIDAGSLVNLQPGQQPQFSTWGVFKADNPRIDQDKTERKGETEFIKYENPAGTERHLYLPIVSEDMAQKVYDKHSIKPTAAERESGFWSVVVNHPEIPITITEGLKKTLASLSQGEVTIGLAGVNGLYRARDEDKQKLPERLLSNEVAIFATPGRSFTFAFDRDAKTSTVFNVRRELVRGVELLEERGAQCKIAKWKPADGKGLDDLIVNQGAQAYAKAIDTAQPTDQEKRTYYRTEYNAIARQVRVNYPDATPEQLDAEVYLRAIAKGEPKDGDRFLSQSDQARSLDTPQQVAAYIEQVKASVPQFLQQRRELEAALAQKAADRAEYMAIAQQVRSEWGNVSPVRVDIEVYLKAGKNGDRVLSQSDNVRTLETHEQVKQYIERIHTAAPQYQNAKALYGKLASGIKKAKVAFNPYRLDLEIQFQARRGNIKDLDQILMHSEVTKAFSKDDPIKAQRYIKALGELATLYENLRGSPNQDAVNQSIPKLVHKKLVDPEAMRRLREEEELRRRQQERQERQR